jgi:hypothetical protein
VARVRGFNQTQAPPPAFSFLEILLQNRERRRREKGERRKEEGGVAETET